MATVSLSMDGVKIQVEAGKTVLEVARERGVDIPALCYDPRLRPFGACRMCLVEVEGARGPVTACTTQVSDGMVVRTRNEEIVALRRMALQLLLSEHHGDCVAPCQRACPAGIDIQGFIALIADGRYREGLELIKEALPFPAVCGRVCPRFCEEECRRHVVDEPLAICHLKRFLADVDLASPEYYTPQVKAPSGKSVGIVGGGPAGLAAAYYLAQEGHEITMYEAMPELGGMLRYGIPEYRLPKAVLDQEIATITALCHEVKCNVRLGRDISIEVLRDRHDVVLLALGAQACQKMRVEGEEMPGVYAGLDFLVSHALGKRVDLGERVALVGGGNTAIDAARTALRAGASEVTVFYRRSRQEMPAAEEEVEQAMEEGVEFRFLAAPIRLVGNGRVQRMVCTEMALGEPDQSGRRRPSPVEGSEFEVEVDSVVSAIGQMLDTKGAEDVSCSRGCFEVSDVFSTALEGVFATGDCVTGPTTVVEACAGGRKVAMAMDLFLKGQPVVFPPKPYNASRGSLDQIDPEEYRERETMPRHEPVLLSPEERRRDYREIDPGFDEETALKEAARCMSCGCQDVFDCKLRDLATEYGIEEELFGTGGYRHPIRDDHPYIIRDANKCVLCGSCVRICSEVQGASALGFVQRGFATTVKPALGLPLEETTCESCGQCISACPTGALTARVPLAKPGPWRLRDIQSVCPECSIGCQLTLRVHGSRLVEVDSPLGNPVNEGNLCHKGAFEYLHAMNAPRITKPLVRRDGQLVEVSWEEALQEAARVLDMRNRYGPGSVGVWVSPRLTNEEAYLAGKLARAALGTNNVAGAYPSTGGALRSAFGRNASTAGFNDIRRSDLIFLFGANLPEDYPVAGNMVRKAVDNGACLISIGDSRTRLDRLARASLATNPARKSMMLKAMVDYVLRHDLLDDGLDPQSKWIVDLRESVSEGSLEAVGDKLWVKPEKVLTLLDLYVRARSPLVIVDLDTVEHHDLEMLSSLVRLTGNDGRFGKGILGLRKAGNAQGLLDMGVEHDLLPGQVSVFDPGSRDALQGLWQVELPDTPGQDYQEMVEGVERDTLRGLLLLGDGTSLPESGTPFAVWLAPFLTSQIAERANVVLPGATPCESEGTHTNCEGRVQEVRRALPPSGGYGNWEVLMRLCEALGYSIEYDAPQGIRREALKACGVTQEAARSGHTLQMGAAE